MSFCQRHVEREILSALVDGELSPSERRFVHEHLQSCESCAEAAEEFGALQGMVGELPRLVAPEAFVSGALEPGERSALRTMLRGRRKWALGVVAAAALSISLAGLATGDPETEPPMNTFIARHVTVSDGVASGGQVLFGVDGE